MELILSPNGNYPRICLYDSVDDPVISRFRWHVVRTGKNKKPYVYTQLGSKPLSMHRLILAASCEGLWVDHINGNGLDNRRDNLRVCTPSQNIQNSAGWLKRKCAYKGVSKISRWRMVRPTTPIWESRICIDRKQIVIGTFRTPEEAAVTYDEQARIHHGKFARLNFPKPGERGLV